MATVRSRLVEGPSSLGAKARQRRSEWFVREFPNIDSLRVLDLGGTQDYWERLPTRPAHVTVLNLAGKGGESPPNWISVHNGDACEPPASVTNNDYDLVFSNSTIEHVGDAARRRAFADVARAMAPAHWVQTPNRAFPLEPHALFPLEQFLPLSGRALVYRYWPLAAYKKFETMDTARDAASRTELVGRREFEVLFPTSRIESEMVLPGLPAKSLIAIRSAEPKTESNREASRSKALSA